jgi:hypothetical protein
MCLSCGCAQYTEAQMRLVEQARKGLDAVKAASAERSVLVAQFQQLQRNQADQAFDADVREAPALSAEWVIEHRRAYAALLDALARQKAASNQAEASAGRNLEAIDAALQRVLLLESIQLRWFSVDGVMGR